MATEYCPRAPPLGIDVRPMKRSKIVESTQTCKHVSFLNGQCRSCGMMFNDIVLPLPYYYSPICKDSYNSNNYSCLNNIVTTIQNPKKMCLVLDLDHTLLNSTNLDDLSLEEDYLKGKSSTISSLDASKRSLFQLNHIGTMTKLRPFVRTFLQEASKMFEMYIYTLGDRSYALEMAKLLDPENKYFDSRIISQDCSSSKTYLKTLDVLGKPDNAVLILDDRECVWQNNKENLILMDKYIYFKSSSRELGYNCKSLAELKRDEDELDGALATVLNVLRRIHREFFNSHQQNDFTKTIDVRQMLKNARKNVLKDCKIVFSGVIPKNFEAKDHHLWRMAEELGATCVSEVGSSVTHVVSIDAGTEKSRWAAREGKFLVHIRWLEASYILWRRQLEGKFPASFPKANQLRGPNPTGK